MPKKRRIGLFPIMRRSTGQAIKFFIGHQDEIISDMEIRDNGYFLYKEDVQKLYDYLVKKADGMYTTRHEAKTLVEMMEGQ